MAGVALRAPAPRNDRGDRVLSGVLAGWGAMIDFCFEGTNCAWRVTGGGRVDVVLSVQRSLVATISTDAPGWRTTRGIHRGSTVRALQRAYGPRIARRTACSLNGFGGETVGYVLNSHHDGERRFTFFELSASRQRVHRVWIGRGRTSFGSAC